MLSGCLTDIAEDTNPAREVAGLLFLGLASLGECVV